MTSASQARIPTENGGKYIRQLCKHWSHKLEVSVEGEEGTVRFPSGSAAMAAGADTLVLTITADDAAEVERLKDVLARHLDRFAFREAPLRYDWTDPAPA